MTRLIDASVLVAAFSPETRTREALVLLSLEAQPVVNALAYAETRISLVRKLKRKEMTEEEVGRALSALRQSFHDGLLTIVPQPEAMWDEAVAIARRVLVHIRTQDALHAACAKIMGRGLATFDDDLAAAGRAEGIDVFP